MANIMKSEDVGDINTVINGIDYWNATKWYPSYEAKKRDNGTIYGSSYYIDDEDITEFFTFIHDKEAYELFKHTMKKFNAAVIIGIVSAIAIIAQLVGIIFFDVFSLTGMIISSLALITSGMLIKNYNTMYPEYGYNSDKFGTEKSYRTNLTSLEANDVASELNKFKDNNNKAEYTKIVKNVVNGHMAITSDAEKRYQLEVAKNEAKVIERKSKNPYLQDINYSDSIVSLESKIKSLSAKEKGINKNIASMLDIFKKLDSAYAGFTIYEKIAYDNCYNELVEITDKFNSTLDNGIKLTDEDIKDYHKLIENCDIILNKIRDGLITHRSDSIKISNNFLEEKYDINSLQKA